MSYKMLLNRKKFLNETEFGRAMEKLVREWDGLLETKETPETIRKEAHCMSQWEVYQLAMKQFYGLDCYFTRTDEYFGIWIEDDATFLLKVDRGQKNASAAGELLSHQPIKPEVREALERTQRLADVAEKYSRSVPDQPVKGVMELVLEQKELNGIKREALQKALWETMKIVLESELLTNAAKRGIEDYKFLVSHNISMMTDSVLGIYERILHEVRD